MKCNLKNQVDKRCRTNSIEAIMRYSLIATLLLLTLEVGLVQCNNSREELRRNQGTTLRRSLQTGIPYKVNLILGLDYLNDTVAVQFENSDPVPSTNASTHFCYAVNNQVCCMN